MVPVLTKTAHYSAFIRIFTDAGGKRSEVNFFFINTEQFPHDNTALKPKTTLLRARACCSLVGEIRNLSMNGVSTS